MASTEASLRGTSRILVDACPVSPGAESLGFELHGIIWGEDSHICRSWLLLLRSRAEKHNTEVLVYDGREIYTCPIRARNLSGRTGRGDTTFAGYINERLTADIPTALRFATALVSLKM